MRRLSSNQHLLTRLTGLIKSWIGPLQKRYILSDPLPSLLRGVLFLQIFVDGNRAKPLDQALAKRFGDGFGLGVDLQLFINLLQMERDRFNAHA